MSNRVIRDDGVDEGRLTLIVSIQAHGEGDGGAEGRRVRGEPSRSAGLPKGLIVREGVGGLSRFVLEASPSPSNPHRGGCGWPDKPTPLHLALTAL